MSKVPSSKRWVNRHCFKSAQSVDQARAEILTPQVQSLNAALRAISAVVQDHGWMQKNDPSRKLDRVVETLIELSAPRRRPAIAKRGSC